MGGVFISYRRDDSRGSAGRLYDDLSDRFGNDLVFRDLDAIKPGAVYDKVISTAIAGCDALIAVIGNSWIDARGADGQRRVDSPKDLVRVEIATALAQGKIVVPVLVEDATMPSEADLPPDLAPLASRNALPISDHRWDYDVGRLVALLDDVVGPPGPAARPVAPPVDAAPPAPSRPPATGSNQRVLVLAVVVLALVAAGAFAVGRKSDSGATSSRTEVSTAGQSALPSGSEEPTAPATGDVAGAIPIAIGDTVENGRPPGAGNIAGPGAKQHYTFDATAGQILYLKTLYKGAHGELGWRLLTPSGTVINSNDMTVDIGRVALYANGSHTIEVAGYEDGTGAYGFVVMPVPADASIAIAIGDTVRNGEPPGAGNIAAAGAKQRYTFEGAAGQLLFLKTSYKGPRGELGWRLLTPSGTVINSNDMTVDIGQVALSANGSHTIEVAGYEDGTGAYGFTLTAVP